MRRKIAGANSLSIFTDMDVNFFEKDLGIPLP
jgi:hypothetical protein